MKKVIVTGATGMIGIYLVNALLRRNNQVYAVVRPGSHNVWRLPMSPNLRVVELSMEEIDKITCYIEEADAFFHLAWEGTRKPYRDDSVLQQKNYVNSVKAMNAGIALKCKVFVGAGSQAEYGIISGKVNERHPCKPVTAYGKEKLHTYHELCGIAEQMGIRFVWMRIFSAYGKFDFPGTLIMSCMEKMKKNLPVELTECIQRWDYIYAGDVAYIMVRFMEEASLSGVYNIATGESYPLKMYVEKLRYIINSHSDVRYGAIPYGTDGPVNLEPVIDKLKKELNWNPRFSFEAGIREMLVENGERYENNKYINTYL